MVVNEDARGMRCPASWTSPEQCAKWLHESWEALGARHDQECVVVLALDRQHRLSGVRVVTIGTLSTSLVHPREVFRPAIALAAECIVMAHNHPSGDATPSAQDHAVTGRITESGRILGIDMLDHVIVTPNAGEWYSFALHGTGDRTAALLESIGR
jgi:DNA repair protein RadC